MEKNIIEGDGSWEQKLAASQCPKCSNTLSLNKTNGNIVCAVCGLEIIDTPISSDMIKDSNEESEMETHLMPDEFSIAAREPRMEWQSAVSLIEGILMDEAEDIEKQDGNPELANELRAAWHRILQG